MLNSQRDLLKRLQEVEFNILIEFDKVCKKLGISYSLCEGTLIGAVRHKGFIPWDDDIDVSMIRKDYETFLLKGEKLLPKYLKIQTYENDIQYPHNFAKVIDTRTKIVQRNKRNVKVETGVYIDIFPIDAIATNKLIRKMDNFLISIIYLTKFMQDKQHIRNTAHPIRRLLKFILHKIYLSIGTQRLNRLETKIRAKNNKEKNKFTYGIRYTFPLSGLDKMEIMPLSIFKEFQRIPFEGYECMAIKDWDIYLKTRYGDYMTLPPEHERVPKHEALELTFKNNSR